MIFDSTIFFAEIDLLELRLNILNPYVDKFIIMEADKTFTGKSKPFNFENNRERFKEFESKIIYKRLHIPDSITWEWDREEYQRNKLKDVWTQVCKDDDIIVLSDLDEIPDFRRVLNYFDNDIEKNLKNHIYSCEQRLHYYYLNLYTSVLWTGTFFARWGFYKTIANYFTPTRVRCWRINSSLDLFKVITGGGWHWAYLGDAKTIKDKITSFSHTEWADTTLEELEERKEKNIDPFGRPGYVFNKVEVDETFPTYILQNKEKLLKYII